MKDSKSKALSSKKDSPLSHVVLGMYDRDFRKPYDKKHGAKVNRAYHKATGKYLSNIDDK